MIFNMLMVRYFLDLGKYRFEVSENPSRMRCVYIYRYCVCVWICSEVVSGRPQPGDVLSFWLQFSHSLAAKQSAKQFN